MLRYVLLFAGALLLDGIIEYLTVGSLGPVEGFKALSFASAALLSYYLDQPKMTLPVKLGLSVGAMVLIFLIGSWWLGMDVAVQGVMKFAMLFVAYYLLASFRSSKSLRS